MKHSFSYIAIFLIAMTTVCTEVHAVPSTGFGAHASTGTASNCPSFCTSANGGDFQSDSAGGEFIGSATSTENTYGNAQASASLSGSSFLPNLAVLAGSDSNRGADATAFAVQAFTFTEASREIILDVDLHAIVSGPENSAGASVAVLLGSELEWFPDFGTLVFEFAGESTTELALGNVFVNSTTTADESTQLTFTLNPGDDFYVVADLSASSRRGGSVDALNTLSMAFDNSSGITAALAVPEPSTMPWLGFVLAGLAYCRRRSSH